MADILVTLSKSFIFWLTWIIIPVLVEIIPAIGGFIVLLKKRLLINKDEKINGRKPEITIIIPIYNSQDTLHACIKSIDDSTYPSELIEIFLVNNMTKDDSFKVFKECQNEFKDLSMQWMNAKQGKSKALNMALFNAQGKYIIHIDSDGILEKHAIMNMVTRFENNNDIHCMTGTILTDPDNIEKTEGFFMRLFRKCEFCEYAQAFLAGRNFESEFDNVFTLSGAFSAFRKSTILKTQMYNTDTVCEDTHVTFQIKKLLKKRVYLCENALFMVDPIEDINKLYTQRQRWQRGELEVANMFLKNEMKATKGFITNPMVRLLMFDHTFAFPRMIWYFALICLMFMNYPMSMVIGSTAVIYLLYVLSAFLYYINILTYLTPFKGLKRYYAKKWYICFLLPLYNFMNFWIRFAGIINSINSSGTWRTRNLSEEKETFTGKVSEDFSFITEVVYALKNKVDGNGKTK